MKNKKKDEDKKKLGAVSCQDISWHDTATNFFYLHLSFPVDKCTPLSSN